MVSPRAAAHTPARDTDTKPGASSGLQKAGARIAVLYGMGAKRVGLTVAVLLCGCAGGLAPDDDAPEPLLLPDAGEGLDAGLEQEDAGHDEDAGPAVDAGPERDAGSVDAGASDAGRSDGGVDAGVSGFDAGSLQRPSLAAVTQALLTPLTRYDVTLLKAGAADSIGMTERSDVHCPVVTALAAYLGDKTPVAGRTPTQRTLEQLKHWAANNMPAGRGGFPAKLELPFVATVAIAWKVDEIRNALTPEERARLTVAMKACLVGSAFDVAKNNNFARLGQPVRSIRGFTAHRTNPNFTTPPQLIPRMVAAFLGRAKAREFMRTFNRAAFAAEIAAAFPTLIDAQTQTYRQAGARVDLWDLYRQNWTQANQGTTEVVGPGPTQAQLESSLRDDFGPWSDYRWGVAIDQDPSPAFIGELERMFSKPIQPGLTNPDASTRSAEPFGIWNAFTNRWAGRIVDRTRWANLPSFTTPRTLGAAFELDSSDAGGDRSGMGYVHDGLIALFSALATAAVYDMFDARSPAFTQARVRTARGMADLLHKLDGSGYQSYAKGGEGTNNNVWSWESRKNSERLIAMYSLYFDVIEPWWSP